MPVLRLVDRFPEPGASRLLAELVPPPTFASVSFDSYRPDPAQPSQAAAVAGAAAFVQRLDEPEPSGRRWFRRPPSPEQRAGIYLDGGFGVGKTHLLASVWHAAPGPKAFATFVELTNLVGTLGFAQTVEALASLRLLCIDEFELDDPGDTVLMSTLLGQLVQRGVRLAATSNTLPDRLGEGRFGADDFLREIQGLSAQFDVIRIDGEDFRHRGLPEAPTVLTPDAVREGVAARAATAAGADGAAGTAGAAGGSGRDRLGSVDQFDELLAHLAQLHPSRYGDLLDGIGVVGLIGVRPVDDQSVALRLVVLADRLYDRGIPVLASGVPLDQLFTPDLLRGGYRKKYFRAVSRLVALATPPSA